MEDDDSDGGPTECGLGDDGIAHDVGYSRAETTTDGVGAILNHAPEARDSDHLDDFGHIPHDLDDRCMAMEGGDRKESDDMGGTYASRDMEVVHHSMS